MNEDKGQFMGHFPENIKDNNNLSFNSKMPSETVNFIMNDKIKLACLRAERLTAAIYLVSGLLSDNEPLKWNVRKIAVELISDIPLLSKFDYPVLCQEDERPIENISTMIFQVRNLLRVGWMGGLFSKMNFEILSAEYEKLNDFLIKNFSNEKFSRSLISKDFFVSEEASSLEEKVRSRLLERKKLGGEFVEDESRSRSFEQRSRIPGEFIKDISFKGHLSDKSESVLNKNYSTNFISPNPTSAPTNGKPTTSVSDKNKRERHDKLLRAISPGISYSVSEIISVIGKEANTSEKTIQRDLQQLVSIGRLKKTGERRWSRYSLI